MPPTSMHVVRRAHRVVPLAATLLTAAALALSGCSSSDSSTPSAAPPSSSSTTPEGHSQLASKVVIGSVAGIVHKSNRKQFAAHRKRFEKLVGDAVDGWLDGGFVGVDYPRDGFPLAFRTFTHEARQEAQHDQRLMTLWSLRHRIDGLTTLRRTVTIDVLAPKGRAAGATARVDLRFRTHGHVTRKVEVKGRLFLAKDTHGAWRIFGYDVTQGAR